MGAKPEEAICVGDVECGFLAARAASVSFAFAGWGAASYVESASYWVHTPAEVELVARYAL